MPKLLTTNSEEATVADLLDGGNIFSIPYFQRPYRWKPARIKQLEEDIENIVDDDKLVHFLGAVIIHGRRQSPSQPKTFDVIDGQQRITTLFLYIIAAAKILGEHGHTDDAVGYLQTYISIGRKSKSGSNLKLHPCKEDRKQINWVIDDLLSDSEISVGLDNYRPDKLTNTGTNTGRLRKNYISAKRFFQNFAESEGPEKVIEVLDGMLERLSIVQIDVIDPTNGPKIFDSLNSRQEPMTIGDLVRNEIFARVSELATEEIDKIDEEHWQPFYGKFRVSDTVNLFDGYFFPFGLIQNPNLSKSEVYAFLRDQWEEIEAPQKIIEELAVYQDSFLAFQTGGTLIKWSKPVRAAIQRIIDLKFPASALPFLMQVAQSNLDGTLDDSDATAILDTTESFFVRRAVCGIEPTGLHALFRRLWVDTGKNPTAEKVAAKIRERKTVLWPGNEFFERSIKTRGIYGSRICPYLIREYDRSLQGDVPSNIPWIEHVLPQTPAKGWFEDFSKEQHKDLLDTFANLIPLSSAMNGNLSNKIYQKKRPKIEADSMFKSARQFAKKFETWTPEKLQGRSEDLAQWALKRWPA